MSEHTRHPNETSILRHQTTTGLTIECQTPPLDQNSGIAAHLSETFGRRVMVPPSTWYFKDTKYAETAETLRDVLDGIIMRDPNAHGLYVPTILAGESVNPKDSTVVPFRALTLAAPAEQVSVEQAATYQHAVANRINGMMKSLGSEVYLPLPATN